MTSKTMEEAYCIAVADLVAAVPGIQAEDAARVVASIADLVLATINETMMEEFPNASHH
jgi:hypothetical protein